MLVLSRKPGEQIVVGDNIRITVLEVSGGKVKIGIDAPANVAILRSELQEKNAVAPSPYTPRRSAVSV